MSNRPDLTEKFEDEGTGGSVSPEDKDLLDQVERDVKGWLPKEGDSIVGRVVDITEGNSEYGRYPLVTLEESDSKKLVNIHAFHTVLKNDIENRIERGNLGIGWTLAVKYVGKGANSSKGNPAELYRTAVRPPQS